MFYLVKLLNHLTFESSNQINEWATRLNTAPRIMNTTIEITERVIQNDDNLLCSLRLSGFNITLYLVYQGSSKLAYYMFLNDDLLFSGKDYRPAPAYGIESLQSIIDCLSFLTVREGDTDSDYFKDYTDMQLLWSRTYDCEQLQGLISDFDDKDSEFHKDAFLMFKKAYKSY